MARQTTVKQIDKQEVDEALTFLGAQPPQVQDYEEETEDDISLANVLAELGTTANDAKVNVYQVEQGKPNAFVGSFSPNDFSMESLQQTYGPGSYKIVVRAGGRIVTHKIARIAKSLVPLFPSQIPQPQFQPDKLVETMQTGFAQMSQMFSSALGQLAQNQPRQKTQIEMLQEFQLMKEIFGGNHQPTDPMAVLNLAKELSSVISPPPNDENSLLMEGIKMFGPLLGQQLAGQQLNNQPRPLPNLPSMPQMPNVQAFAPQPVQQAQAVQAHEENSEMFINMYIRTLVANAKADNEPLTYAHAILDLVGDDAARQFIARPDWFDEVVKRNAEAATYREWFDELKLNIQQLLTAPPDSGTDAGIPQNEIGDAIHAAQSNPPAPGDKPA